jgi:hypothetical protein
VESWECSEKRCFTWLVEALLSIAVCESSMPA